MAADMGHF